MLKQSSSHKTADTKLGDTQSQGTMKRVLALLFSFYPVLIPAVIVAILLNGLIQSFPNIFMQNVLSVVSRLWEHGTWDEARTTITANILILIAFYALGLLCNTFWTQATAIITQGSLKKFRTKMFNHMQELPIRYFDSHLHGDIMSYYTNDIDAMRLMISQSLPQILFTSVMLLSVFCIMVYYSIWMAMVVIAGVLVMVVMTGYLGKHSSQNFIAQQQTIAQVEGHVEEMMAGQKVIKVFVHEQQTKEAFDELNTKLELISRKANTYANAFMPILMNMGNILYIIVAAVAGLFLICGVQNFSVSGMPFSIALVVPFLTMTKQFVSQIGQISMQINAITMGLAGAKRIFNLLDEPIEEDSGYVELVHCTTDSKKGIVPCQNYTGLWAWKHPHHDGTISYTPLQGDISLSGVHFGYTPGHTVLHDISLEARPGQKIAFVGATGAGKTTITNLLNRFYDISSGKIHYDSINIHKIKKSSLRKSLGVVLQDTNLFTGTVMDNIRYGKLEASDEECRAAAHLVGADSFIQRLPQGYNTILTDNGSALSQGQRQLITIARAAVADPPVMILDEATSSIDTRTESIVQRGMDALMQGRTTFVIAHRLSTVRNADVIVVLDHGKIIERGTHDELIKAQGTYYQLYTGAFELE